MQRAHMKSTMDELMYNRDLDSSQKPDSAGVQASVARVHQKTQVWATSHGVYYLPAGETRRSHLGQATTPAPIYVSCSSGRPATRMPPLHLRETKFAGSRAHYMQRKPRPQSAASSVGSAAGRGDSSHDLVDPSVIRRARALQAQNRFAEAEAMLGAPKQRPLSRPGSGQCSTYQDTIARTAERQKEALDARREATALRARLREVNGGADVMSLLREDDRYELGKNRRPRPASAAARLLRPSSRQGLPPSSEKITDTGELRYLDEKLHSSLPKEVRGSFFR